MKITIKLPQPTYKTNDTNKTLFSFGDWESYIKYT